LSDAAIGRQLGISYRTLQRRIHHLTAGMHAQTRFQLGIQAGRRTEESIRITLSGIPASQYFLRVRRIGVWVGLMTIGPTAGLLGAVAGAPWWAGCAGWVAFAVGLGGLLMRLAQGPAVLRTGVPGDATVTGISDTGASVNDRPVFRFALDVQLPGQDRYPATAKSAAPRVLTAAGAVRPGMWVPVRVDPAKPAEVAIDWSILEYLPVDGLERGLPPAVMAARLFERVKDEYERRRGSRFEVCTLTLTPGLARQLGIGHFQGLLLLHVPEGGTEARAGMAPGDVVLTTGGQPVRTPEDVVAIVNPQRRGDWVPVTLVRDGRELTLSVEKDF
jgi:uncharacterized protein DUF3592/PDZ domain-containing protein